MLWELPSFLMWWALRNAVQLGFKAVQSAVIFIV